MNVAPHDVPGDVFARWDRDFEAKLQRYHQSPEYKKKLERDKIRSRESQSRIDSLMAQLPSVISNQKELMIWLGKFSGEADNIHVKFDRDLLIDTLENAGYRQDDGVGDDPASYEGDPLKMARWVIGQALSCMKMRISPHPIIQGFVEKYLKTL